MTNEEFDKILNNLNGNNMDMEKSTCISFGSCMYGNGINVKCSDNNYLSTLRIFFCDERFKNSVIINSITEFEICFFIPKEYILKNYNVDTVPNPIDFVTKVETQKQAIERMIEERKTIDKEVAKKRLEREKERRKNDYFW